MSSFLQALLRFTAVAVILACTAAAPSISEELENPAQEMIVFLRLHRDKSGIKLLDSNIRPGRLKPRFQKGDIEFEIVSRDGEKAIHSGRLSEPLVQRYEYESPEEPGKLKVHIVERDSVEFVLRIPHCETAKALRFFKWQVTPEGKIAAQSSRNLIAEIPLDGAGAE